MKPEASDEPLDFLLCLIEFNEYTSFKDGDGAFPPN